MARILVIGDEVDSCLNIKTILKSRGHNVVLEECGRSALAAMELFGFDAVVVDSSKPGSAGTHSVKTLVEILSDIAPGLPIVAIGGRPEYSNDMTTNFVRAAFDLGTAVCLRKPFKEWQLVEAVDRCCSVVAFAKFVA